MPLSHRYRVRGAAWIDTSFHNKCSRKVPLRRYDRNGVRIRSRTSFAPAH